MLNKRGSVPIVILVLLTIAIFGFALFSFSQTASKMKGEISSGYKASSMFKVERNELDYLGESKFVEPVEVYAKVGIIFTDEFLDVEVRQISWEWLLFSDE